MQQRKYLEECDIGRARSQNNQLHQSGKYSATRCQAPYITFIRKMDLESMQIGNVEPRYETSHGIVAMECQIQDPELTQRGGACDVYGGEIEINAVQNEATNEAIKWVNEGATGNNVCGRESDAWPMDRSDEPRDSRKGRKRLAQQRCHKALDTGGKEQHIQFRMRRTHLVSRCDSSHKAGMQAQRAHKGKIKEGQRFPGLPRGVFGAPEVSQETFVFSLSFLYVPLSLQTAFDPRLQVKNNGEKSGDQITGLPPTGSSTLRVQSALKTLMSSFRSAIYVVPVKPNAVSEGENNADTISLPPYPFHQTVFYVISEDQANDALRDIVEEKIGIDTEFTDRCPTIEEHTIIHKLALGGVRKSALLGWQLVELAMHRRYPIAWDHLGLRLIQIATDESAFVLDMRKIRAFPKELRRVLLSPLIKKVEVGLTKDISVLWATLCHPNPSGRSHRFPRAPP
ncbi:hypothetical protein B0H19DRAFT_1084889 [Mycena capillaripes]|nr:hypothetical protein B0H19DRAFT_1084889 [Mycena capillaripes]